MATNITLYHGTGATALPAIAQHGIMPRGRDGKRNNWKHTVGSNAACVYLTDAYPLHFAMSAASTDNDEDLAIIEVEVSSVFLQADEDALEQVMRNRPDNEPERIRNADMKARTIYYRSRAHLYKAADSLQALGTCSHRGPIKVSALRRVVVIKHAEIPRLVLHAGLDPIIHILNYKIMGGKYRQSVKWMFGDEATLLNDHNNEITRDGITVYSSIDDALGQYRERPASTITGQLTRSELDGSAA